MMNSAAMATTAHANAFARFAVPEIKAHPHLIADSGRSYRLALFGPRGQDTRFTLGNRGLDDFAS
jgi:hypothetical protein